VDKALDVTPPDPLKPPAPTTAPPINPPAPKVLSQPQLALPAQKPKTQPAPKSKAQKPTEKVAPSAGPSAPKQGQNAKGGAAKVSSAAYAKAVLKKVRATKKKSGAGKGVAVVGFTVGTSGALAGVKVLRSSGNAALDQMAVGHVQRSAPFPTPPKGAGRSFSFEFIGK
jgi:periplasmic protein TonB